MTATCCGFCLFLCFKCNFLAVSRGAMNLTAALVLVILTT